SPRDRLSPASAAWPCDHDRSLPPRLSCRAWRPTAFPTARNGRPTTHEGRKDSIPRDMKGTLARTYGVKGPFMRRGVGGGGGAGGGVGAGPRRARRPPGAPPPPVGGGGGGGWAAPPPPPQG